MRTQHSLFGDTTGVTRCHRVTKGHYLETVSDMVTGGDTPKVTNLQLVTPHECRVNGVSDTW